MTNPHAVTVETEVTMLEGAVVGTVRVECGCGRYTQTEALVPDTKWGRYEQVKALRAWLTLSHF